MTLSFLPQLAFVYLLIFSRIGAIVMLMPGIGETYISARIRLVFALLLTLVFYPILSSNFAVVPDALGGIFILLFQEVMIGLFILVILHQCNHLPVIVWLLNILMVIYLN